MALHTIFVHVHHFEKFNILLSSWPVEKRARVATQPNLMKILPYERQMIACKSRSQTKKKKNGMSIFTTPNAIESVSEKTAARAARMYVRGTEMVWLWMEAHFTTYTLVKYFYDIHIIFEKFLCVLLCRHYLVSLNPLFFCFAFSFLAKHIQTRMPKFNPYTICAVCAWMVDASDISIATVNIWAEE